MRSNPGSTPVRLAVIGSRAIYYAQDRVGLGVWVSDSAASTQKLLPLLPAERPLGTPLARGSSAVFAVTRGQPPSRTQGLYVTDGTPAGTRRVALPNGQRGSTVQPLAALPSGWLLAITLTTGGSGLWFSDGTTAGTRRLRQFSTAQWLTLPAYFSVDGSIAWFSVGSELWQTDGTVAGTRRIVDVGWNVGSRLIHRGRLYFAARNQLWVSDGTAAGTRPLATVGQVGELVSLGARVLFSGSGNNGTELWVSDGTTAGTRLLKDLEPGPGGSWPREFVLAGPRVFFSAETSAAGRELWLTDGTAAGTVMVADAIPGSLGLGPIDMVRIGAGVFFSGWTAATGRELWRSDGTAAGTKLVTEVHPGPGNGLRISPSSAGIHAFAGGVVFAGQDAVGVEPWFSAGTPASTIRLRDIHGPASASLRVRLANEGTAAVEHEGDAYFVADDGVHGQELWRSDGTLQGTRLVSDLRTGAEGSEPQHLHSAGRFVLFSAANSGYDRELWRTDGTAIGTRMVKDINPGRDSSDPIGFVTLGEYVYFSALQPMTGRELWRTDGTAAGTTLVAELAPGSSGSVIDVPVVLGDAVYFFGSAGRVLALWRSDGTAAGTKPIASIAPWFGSLVAWNDRLLFTTSSQNGGAEPWISDGTAAGTRQLRDLVPGPGGSGPFQFVSIGRHVLFLATTPATGYELWRTDGTAAGTVLVTELVPGPDSCSIQRLVATGEGSAFFVAETEAHGEELWVTDGTAAGTRLVRDLHPGALSGVVRGSLAPVGDGRRVGFAGTDGRTGIELWVSDGTAAGTFSTGDAVPGPEGLNPSGLLAAGDRLMFSGDDGSGRELWQVKLSETGASRVGVLGIGCPGTGGLRPTLRGIGVPRVPAPSFAIEVGSGLPRSLAVLHLATQRRSLDLGACRLYPAAPWAAVGASLDGRGGQRIPLAIPANPSLVGASLLLQASIVDPLGSVFGIASVTNGLWVVVGR